MDKFIAGDGLQDAAANNANAIVDYTDETATVSLIAVPFVAGSGVDPADIPASANFNVPVSSAVPIVVTVPGLTNKRMVWPDPAGGWKFTSTGMGFPITITGYRVDSTSSYLGCQNLPNVIVTAAGQVIYIGEVSLPISPASFSGD